MPALYVDDDYVAPDYVQTGVTILWGSRVIFVPKHETTLVQITPSEIREMDLDVFRLALKDLEDGEAGQVFPDTHRHNTEVSIGGLTLARVIEIINRYTVTFEDGPYAVNLTGANSNVGDRVNVNQVSVRSNNSAGLVVTGESGLSGPQDAILTLIRDILEADEEIRSTTFKKFLKGTVTPLVVKDVTRAGSDVDLTEP